MTIPIVKYVDYLHTDFGILRIGATDSGVCSISRVVIKAKKFEGNEHTEECKAQLEQYIAGNRKEFTVPLMLPKKSEFYSKVWNALKEIPYGATSSYLDIATTIGDPKSVRAVGLANGKNPIPILIPCHRVIGSNGSLTGYSGGLDMKKHLLMLENPEVFGVQKELF